MFGFEILEIPILFIVHNAQLNLYLLFFGGNLSNMDNHKINPGVELVLKTGLCAQATVSPELIGHDFSGKRTKTKSPFKKKQLYKL
jgi:hypothetical protein